MGAAVSVETEDEDLLLWLTEMRSLTPESIAALLPDRWGKHVRAHQLSGAQLEQALRPLFSKAHEDPSP